MIGDDWVNVIPAKGEVKETARALLDIATDPGHVLTARGGSEFLVAPYVADAYNTPKRPRKRPVKKETDS
jgi:hypothetical protein